MTQDGRHTILLPYLAAAVLYASVLLVWTWPLALDADRYAGVPPERDVYDLYSRNDQLLSIWGAAANARALLDLDFARLIDNGTCWPLPNAAALGEHMIELGILAVPAYALTEDPLIAYNTACLLIVVIAGVAMFALVRSWTGSTAAALVAGFLYAYHPTQINNLIHPAVIGIHWIPLVLLMFERVVTTGTFRAVASLWLFAVLTCLTGSYPMLAFFFFGAPYGVIRLVQLRSRVTRVGIFRLGVAVVGVACVIFPLLAQYSLTEQDWYSLRPRYTAYMAFSDLLPGRYTGVGALVLPLAACAVLFRKRRVGEPVVALVVAGAVCALLSCQGPLWPGGPPLRSLYAVLAEHVSLLMVVRAPALIRMGVYLALAGLAGIGIARALATQSKAIRITVCSVLLATALAEIFIDPIAVVVYDMKQEFVLRDLRPHDDVLAVYAAFDERGFDGPILDIPYNTKWGQFAQMPNYMLYAAYHGRPTAACYNSFLPHTYDNAGRLADRFIVSGDPAELESVGYRNVVWHGQGIGPIPSRLTDARGAEVLEQNEHAAALRLTGNGPTHHDAKQIRPERLYQLDQLKAGVYDPRLRLTLRNDSDATWALPLPITVTRATLTWYSAHTTGTNSYETPAPLLLPLSITGRGTDSIPVPVVPLPPPGSYRVSLDVPAMNWHLLSDELVTID